MQSQGPEINPQSPYLEQTMLMLVALALTLELKRQGMLAQSSELACFRPVRNPVSKANIKGTRAVIPAAVLCCPLPYTPSA